MHTDHNRALEMELDVLAGLVVEMDCLDTHILEVASTIAGRMQEYAKSRANTARLANQIVAIIQAIQKGSLSFEKGYGALCSSIQMLQRDVQSWAMQVAHNENLLPGERGVTTTVTHGITNHAPQGDMPADVSGPSELRVAVVKQAFDPNDPDNAMFIAEVEECLGSAEMSLLAFEKDSGDLAHLNEAFRCFHNIKGISGFVNLSDFQELCHHAESLMEGARTGALEFKGSIADTVFRALDLLKDMVRLLKMSREDSPYETPSALRDVVAALKNHCMINSPLGEPGPSGPGEPKGGKPNKPGGRRCNGLQAGQPKGGSEPSVQPAVIDEVVRVSTKRLDALLDEIGELVIANSMVTQEVEGMGQAGSKLIQNVGRMNKIVRQLQELTMGMRMVSLEPTFNKLARVVRDLSHKKGVEVGLICDGGDTELDRKIVEFITNPLTHLIRNAIDHGIEKPDERKKLGKPAEGQIRLSAFHQGGSVAVRIEDDGRGLDKAQIVEKATELGIIRPNENLTDREILQLIFAPGFSTSQQVTDISGRGVGMDVVKRNIEGLRGKIDIQTQPGKGTTFTLWLPLTMAIIDGMIVTVGSQRFIVPSISIQEAFRPEPEDVKTVMGKGECIFIRGKLIPLYRLYTVLGLEGARTNPWESLVLVTYLSDGQCGILVDDLVGQQQVVVKPAGNLVDKLDFISGAAIMGDGRVALILDLSQVVRTKSRWADR